VGQIIRKIPAPNWISKILDPFEDLPCYLRLVIAIPLMFATGARSGYSGYWMGGIGLSQCLVLFGFLLGAILPPHFPEKGDEDWEQT
jgi:hypothetical protein